MARRIRSLKPELLEDEKVAGLSDTAFRAWVACIVTADDHGTFRAEPRLIEKNVYWVAVPERSVRDALGELQVSGMVKFYRVRGQTYGRFLNWLKHQRIDNAAKTGQLPTPEQADEDVDFAPRREPETYFPRDGEAPRILAANAFSNAAETKPLAAPRGSLGRGGEGRGEEGEAAASGSIPIEPSAAIERELRRHPSLAKVATAEMAIALAGRFATAEIQRGVRLEWVLDAVRECAVDAAGADLNAEAVGKKLRSYCDHAKRPRGDQGAPTGSDIRADRMASVQLADLAMAEGAKR